MVRNFIETYHSCRGDYIAYLDGDDYWTCPDKLEKQIAFLDDRPSYAMCCHNVLVATEGETSPPTVLTEPYGRSTIDLNDLPADVFVMGLSTGAIQLQSRGAFVRLHIAELYWTMLVCYMVCHCGNFCRTA